MMKVIGLYKAKIKRIGPKSEFTGIYKYPIDTAMVDKLGIQGDVQIDKRFHGGPERALHQYAFSSYEKIIKAYPLLHQTAKPGSMGENVSIAEMHERNVCIGDIYKMGEITVQVSSPRMPCFKISERFRTPNLDHFVAKHSIHGWYYRVLESGNVSVGNQVSLIERPNPEVTVATFLHIVRGSDIATKTIKLAAEATGLDPDWKEKLHKQLAWIK